MSGGHGGDGGNAARDDAAFAALLEDSAEDLYENAPCGYLSTLMDGRIVKINTTLLGWLGYRRADLVGRRYFSDLLTVGGRLYHETHYAPMLRMHGEVGGIALELRAADGRRRPVLLTSTVKTGGDGTPVLIRTTVFDARDRRAYETELLRARQESEREHERLRRLNATLQATLLPPALGDVAGLDTAAHYHIASTDEVGGDFYDLFPLAGGASAFFLGDVRGKGADAAVVTSLARYTLRTAAAYDPTPASVLATLNTALNRQGDHGDPRFCTVVLGTLAAEEGGAFRVTLASGGHPPALLMRADGTTDYLPTPGGQLLGVLPDAHIATVSVRLGAGDTLMLYTDGLTEARTDDGADRFGDDALLAFARGLAPTTASDAVAAVRGLLDTFASGLEDDTAVLAMTPLPPAVRGGESPDGDSTGRTDLRDRTGRT